MDIDDKWTSKRKVYILAECQTLQNCDVEIRKWRATGAIRLEPRNAKMLCLYSLWKDHWGHPLPTSTAHPRSSASFCSLGFTAPQIGRRSSKAFAKHAHDFVERKKLHVSKLVFKLYDFHGKSAKLPAILLTTFGHSCAQVSMNLWLSKIVSCL